MENPSYATLQLKGGKMQSINRRHPWIFSGAFTSIPKELKEGDKVSVVDPGGNIVATGHFGKGSIAVRILSFSNAELNKTFYHKTLQNAYDLRNRLNLTDSNETNAYRLVHGEGDSLPGLVIDIYKNVAVIQTHSAGMENDIGLIVDGLKGIYGDKIGTYFTKSADKNANTHQKGIEAIVIKENSLSYKVDYQKGQKTGFFLDQRDNRHLLSTYSGGKKILNAFSYTGGFSIYALEGGASEVHSLDSSASAMKLVEENLELNSIDPNRHISLVEDALKYLNSERAENENYNIIVLDPPAFAKHRSARHRAIQAYKRLNARAMKILKPGSLLFTFSCSQVVTPDLFNSTIAAAAIEANRKIRILHHLHQPADHPVSIFHPEGEYLKGLVLSIE